MNTCCEKGTNLTKALAEPVLPWEVEWTKVPILSNQSNYSVLSTPPVAKYQTQNTKGEGHTEIDKKKCLEQQNQQTAEQYNYNMRTIKVLRCVYKKHQILLYSQTSLAESLRGLVNHKYLLAMQRLCFRRPCDHLRAHIMKMYSILPGWVC